MPNHSWPETLKRVWGKRVVRAVALLVVATVAGLAQYRLAHIPLAVDVGDPKKVSIPPIRSGEKLIVTGLIMPAEKRPLFAYQGDQKEVVDIHLERASVSAETRTSSQLDEAFGSVDSLAYTTQAPRTSTGVCTTDVTAVANESALPTRIVLFQSEGPGNQMYRNLAVELDREVVVNISTNPPATPPTDTDDDGPGCIKLLTRASLKHRLEGGLLLSARLAPEARLDFRFLPLSANAPWGDYAGMFQPLRFMSPIFEATGISINSANGSTLFEASSSSPDQPLRVNKLKVGSDELQAEISGKGFVKVQGEPLTLSIFDRIKDNPLVAALFLALNGALATWLLSQLNGLFKTQKAQPPKTKRRKR